MKGPSAIVALMVLLLSADHAAAQGREVSPAQFPEIAVAAKEKLPDGSRLIRYKDGSLLWIRRPPDGPLLFSPEEAKNVDPKKLVRRDSDDQAESDAPLGKPTLEEAKAKRAPRTAQQGKSDEDPPADRKPAEPEPATENEPEAKPASSEEANSAAGDDASLQKPLIVVPIASERVGALAFTSDGKELVVAPKEKNFWRYEASSGKRLGEVKSMQMPVTLFIPAASPGQMYVVEKYLLRLVNLKSGENDAFWGGGTGCHL